jgi:hypothetical protein
VLVLVIAFVVVLQSFRADGRRESSPVAILDAAGPYTKQDVSRNLARINARIVSVDDAKQQITYRLTFGIPQSLVESTQLLKQPMFLATNSREGGKLLTYAAGELDQTTDVTLNLDGHLRDYPFDTYRDDISFYFTQFGTSNANPQVIPTATYLTGAVPGFSISLGKAVDRSNPQFSSFTVRVRRASSTLFFAIFVTVLLWALALTAVAISITLAYVRHDIGPGVLGFLAALLFAFPAIRSTLPGTPPIGSFNDYLGFFWAEAIVAVTVIALAVVFIAREVRTRDSTG